MAVSRKKYSNPTHYNRKEQQMTAVGRRNKRSLIRFAQGKSNKRSLICPTLKPGEIKIIQHGDELNKYFLESNNRKG